MASPNIIDLKGDGGWCDEPWTNLRPTDVGLTKPLVTKSKMLSAAMQWLTSKNSTEPLSSFVQICQQVSSKPLFLNTVLRADLIPISVDSDSGSESVIQTMSSMNLQNSSVCSKISAI